MITLSKTLKVVVLLAAAAMMCMPTMAASPQPTPAPAVGKAVAGKDHGRRGHRGYRYAGRLPRRYRAWGFPYYGFGFYGPYYRWPSHYYGAPDTHRAVNNGAIDLNIKPKSAHVYLNGIQVGRVRHFDGWPQYLYVPEGEHELIFYKKGYESVRKKVEVVAGMVLRAEMEMVKGIETPVAALSTARKERIDERKMLLEKYGKDRPWPPAEGVQKTEPAAPQGDIAEAATLVLEVRPVDAVIYLDGKFLGSAAQIVSDGGTLSLTEGPHTLEVMRPGHKPKKTTFEASAGKTLRLAISLELDAE